MERTPSFDDHVLRALAEENLKTIVRELTEKLCKSTIPVHLIANGKVKKLIYIKLPPKKIMKFSLLYGYQTLSHPP